MSLNICLSGHRILCGNAFYLSCIGHSNPFWILLSLKSWLLISFSKFSFLCGKSSFIYSNLEDLYFFYYTVGISWLHVNLFFLICFLLIRHWLPILCIKLKNCQTLSSFWLSLLNFIYYPLLQLKLDILIFLIFINFTSLFFLSRVSLCHPGCSAVVRFQFTTTSITWVQAILLPQPLE